MDKNEAILKNLGYNADLKEDDDLTVLEYGVVKTNKRGILLRDPYVGVRINNSDWVSVDDILKHGEEEKRKLLKGTKQYDPVDHKHSSTLFISNMNACIKEWLDDLECRCGPDGDKAYVTIDGESYPYVTLMWTHGGDYIKPEGYECVDFETPGFAWKMFVIAFNEYSKDRKGKIYWRERPEIMEHVYSPRFKAYAVYARLYIAEV